MNNPYAVGRLARLIDTHVQELTPGCVGNLSGLPDRWPVILRHVIDAARNHAATCEVIAGLESEPWQQTGNFWLGYYSAARA